MTGKKILLFEPFDTEFGGAPFEHSATYLKFLLNSGYEPVFVLGGIRTRNLEDFLKKMNVKYYKLGVPVYKSKSRLPGPVKLMINFLNETIRHIKIIKIAQELKIDLINLLTFGIYEPFQLFLAVKYTNCKIPMLPIVHMITTEESNSLNPKTFTNKMVWSFSFIFLRQLLKSGNVTKIVLYTDMAKDFFERNVTKHLTKIDLPVCLDYKTFSYSENDSRKLLNLPQDTKLFVVLSPDAKGKSVDELLAGLTTINENYKLVLAGYFRPIFEEKVKLLILKHNLKNNVILVNKFLDTEERFHYLNAADVVLLPYQNTYKRNKANSHILLECITLLKAVIITNGVAEGDELVRKHNLGLVTDNTPQDWTKSISNVIQRLDEIKNTAKINADKIRDRWDYIKVLKAVYDLS